jgi:hypothetical protein
MCRYAMSYYKSHYACFGCRKTFKRRLMWDIQRSGEDRVPAKCPQCGELMANMGLDFAAPKKDDLQQWEHIKTLFTVGIAFHSCGCSGPGYIPSSKEALIIYFKDILNQYHHQLNFWRERQEPTNQQERDRENSKYWHFISQIPFEKRSNKKEVISNEAAKIYWFEKIREVEQKLSILSAR